MEDISSTKIHLLRISTHWVWGFLQCNMQIGMRHQKSSCEQSVMLCCGAEASETADFSATYVCQNIEWTGTLSIFLVCGEVIGEVCISKFYLASTAWWRLGKMKSEGRHEIKGWKTLFGPTGLGDQCTGLTSWNSSPMEIPKHVYASVLKNTHWSYRSDGPCNTGLGSKKLWFNHNPV